MLVEKRADSVAVTWGLGDVVPGPVEYFGYEVFYYGVDGNGGKRFGARFGEKATAHVWDNASSTQANYDGDCITIEEDSMVVIYRDASLALEEIGTIAAFSHINGQDAQTNLAVALLN